MGNIGESMINGLLCEQCGVLIDGDVPGYSRLCSDCQPSRNTQARSVNLRHDIILTLDGPHRNITTDKFLAFMYDGEDAFIELYGLDIKELLEFRANLDNMIIENMDILEPQIKNMRKKLN